MILLDANIFMYAAGHRSSQQQPCRAFLEKVVEGKAPPCCTNAEILQEILHRYRAIQQPQLGFRIFDSVVALGIPILPVGEDEVRRARRLLQAYPTLSTRDGVHAGVMEARGIVEVMSFDKGFGSVDWLRRIEP